MMDSARIAKALSEPIRYQILLMIARSQKGCSSIPGGDIRRLGLCNCDLMAGLGMIQSRVSYHMKELVEAGLVREEPCGRWKFYSINPEALNCFIRQLEKDFSLKG
jgi:ArsR family transcriptional regulator